MASVRSFEDVLFTFQPRGDDDADFGLSEQRLEGNVIVRPDAMVLEIFDPENTGPYLMVGRPVNAWYEATNSSPTLVREVRAKWVLLDGTHLGFWYEHDMECFFTFSLDSARVV